MPTKEEIKKINKNRKPSIGFSEYAMFMASVRAVKTIEENRLIAEKNKNMPKAGDKIKITDKKLQDYGKVFILSHKHENTESLWSYFDPKNPSHVSAGFCCGYAGESQFEVLK